MSDGPATGEDMKIIVCEFIDAEALAAFPAAWSVRYDPGLADDRGALLRSIADADGIIVRNKTLVDADLLAAAPRLAVIGRVGVGLDNFDLEACAARGVAVRSAVGANAQSVAEYVIAALLRLIRGDLAAAPRLIAGAWPRLDMIGGEIAGRRLGLVGLGHCGRAVAVRARALGLSVAASDPYLDPSDPAWAGVERLDQEALFARSDILSLHCPLTDETRGLIDAAALERLPEGAVLINSARGPVIEPAAVAAALRAGRLSGAAIDVYAEEPLTAEAARVFEAAPNLLLTPHIAGVTRQSNRRVSDVAVAGVIEVLGQARN